MKECHWETIDKFNSLFEFEQFVLWMGKQVDKGNAIEVPVKKKYAGEMIKERWFICDDCGVAWRLVYPDPGYFPGYFGIVENKDINS